MSMGRAPNVPGKRSGLKLLGDLPSYELSASDSSDLEIPSTFALDEL
jgi:hypothetical protein